MNPPTPADIYRAERERRRLHRQDLRLLKILVDGVDDLDWAAIFASIDPGQDAGKDPAEVPA